MADIGKISEAWKAAWAGKDSDAFTALFTKDATYRDDQAGRFSRGHEELRAFHAHFAAAMSGVEMKFTRLIHEGENACMEWQFRGTQSGNFHGRPPTGITVESKGISLLKVTDDGLVSDCVDYYDGLALVRQLEGGGA